LNKVNSILEYLAEDMGIIRIRFGNNQMDSTGSVFCPVADFGNSGT